MISNPNLFKILKLVCFIEVDNKNKAFSVIYIYTTGLNSFHGFFLFLFLSKRNSFLIIIFNLNQELRSMTKTIPWAQEVNIDPISGRINHLNSLSDNEN
jgi:hypothetical protein